MWMTRGSRFALLFVSVGTVAACSSEETSEPATSADSGVGGSEAGAGKDGAVSIDGGAGTGGSDAADGGCVHTGPPLVDPKALPVCPLCEGARCVPKGLVPKEQLTLLADCDDASKCVPDGYIEKMGKFILPTCKSIAGNEGRCVSKCLPEIAAQASTLPQDVCAATDLCAPCFDPFTGQDTGACGVSCDPGPTSTPVLFKECCGGLGACVPEAMVPAEQKSQLGSEGCSGPGELCTPKILASGTKPAVCKSVGGSEGRCLPACLPAIAAQAKNLSQDTCATGELCAPCYDPFTAAPTGSCSINGDTPQNPPTSFAKCCSGIGVCVPESLVPAAQKPMLGKDSCTDSTTLCVPNELANGTKPAACVSIAGAEGRCLPGCLPAIAAQASQLPQSTCPSTHECAPCYDPLTGVATGSCSVNGDAPTKPPVVFAKCCEYAGTARGTCIPIESLTASQVSSLPKDTCPSDQWRCVPNLKVQNPTAKFPACTAVSLFGSQPGACVPDCMVSGWQGWLLSQGSCKAGEKCAPCQNPLGGGSSGACD